MAVSIDSGRGIPGRQEIQVAVNAFLQADKAAGEGDAGAGEERRRQLGIMQNRFWMTCQAILSSVAARRRGGLEFANDERLFMDMGLVDVRMLGPDSGQESRAMLEELRSKGVSGCFYMSEWLASRYHQLQLESDIAGGEAGPENVYESQLREVRSRVLSRLNAFFAGLPGVPLEVSEAMRSGDLDKAVIAAGIQALREPRRKLLLRRRNLWLLREQIINKARARAGGQATLRLFELLNEVYARDWRARYDLYLQEERTEETDAAAGTPDGASGNASGVEDLMNEARQMRMRVVLMAAVEGMAEPDVLLHGKPKRIARDDLAAFLPLAQSFDRSLTELPPLVIVPGFGRGFFAWEAGVVLLCLRPLVGLDDSVATAFAWHLMLADRFQGGGALRIAYEKKFPGASFPTDFPVDYRAWLCRLGKGEINAMNPDKRAFFREHIGPDLAGPILPPNLRNIGPQTMVAICRRLERQVASSEGDANLHRRLAALYWQQGNMEAAGLQFNAAMQMAPDDGETMFAAGMFMRSRDDGEAAAECFRFGAERAPETMWAVYCQDALANQL